MVYSAEAKADRFPVKCYVLGKILFVPHYTEFGIYAQPGYTDGRTIRTGSALTERQLQLMGATAVDRHLWRRSRS